MTKYLDVMSFFYEIDGSFITFGEIFGEIVGEHFTDLSSGITRYLDISLAWQEDVTVPVNFYFLFEIVPFSWTEFTCDFSWNNDV